MPELPEVETVRRGLAPHLDGALIETLVLNRADLRFPFPSDLVQRVSGRRVLTLGRRAKYLLIPLNSGETLILHLGMSGRMIVERGGEADATAEFHHDVPRLKQHDHVIFRLEGGTQVVFNDPRRFGSLDLQPNDRLEETPSLAALGLEPLGNALNRDALAGLLAGRRTPMKAALLDQRLIAGLGNIYVCEALHRSRIAPTRPAGSLAGREVDALVIAIRDVLAEAIEAGGSTLRDFRHEDGSLGYFQHAFRVYDREGEPCPTPGCRGLVRRLVQSGRSTFHCLECQR
ncbi:bifunctional DNA-formamidopyrimidine glycosylase/DNA-(apurinic or apyrimidinic site) lyase [Rhabdaerophilum sp. SD176]|uniref:bifunctional DNA-formamidopyrimidine glycosylase/DNA-(apurinic or apyrimidinic site) lyase n=1 Tax=Rhabdaerophilum sp. SD176 TaxID=2983548 RepID=UPI0024E00853|nr:bifunctional DNA-formamidopyrimidine glycosylase/DNA-(apurinic or apyrimidinic site) lyase [Rhabdaerophilum sp. SD176]